MKCCVFLMFFECTVDRCKSFVRQLVTCDLLLHKGAGFNKEQDRERNKTDRESRQNKMLNRL